MTPGANFTVTVEGVGDFVFRRRTLDSQFKILAAAVRMLGGETVAEHLHMMAVAVETVRHLTVTAPDGWSIEDIDPLDQEQIDRVLLVFGRLRAAEDTFRFGAKAKRADLGTGA